MPAQPSGKGAHTHAREVVDVGVQAADALGHIVCRVPGGGDGVPAGLERVSAGGDVEELPSKVPFTEARVGDRFVCVGPAGSGYGGPLKPDPGRVLDDVLDGIITRETAERDYGVVITDAGVVDGYATSARRE